MLTGSEDLEWAADLGKRASHIDGPGTMRIVGSSLAVSTDRPLRHLSKTPV